MSTRFYCPDRPSEGRMRLGADEARHLSRVCRLGVGDFVEVFDGRGLAMRSEVVAMGTDWVELRIDGTPSAERPSPFELTLATAVPKGDRFDWLVEKATELGVDRLVPLVTERSVVEPGDSKLSRLRRTIIEASKQCGRNRLMALESPSRWEPLIDSRRESMKVLADPGGIPPWLSPTIPRGRSVILAVGPEGGFSARERDLALAAGWSPISFGVNTMRIETAALAGSAVLFSRMREPTD